MKTINVEVIKDGSSENLAGTTRVDYNDTARTYEEVDALQYETVAADAVAQEHLAYTARAPEDDKVILDYTASGDYDKQSHGTEVAETSRSGVVIREGNIEGEPAPEDGALLDVPGRNSELA